MYVYVAARMLVAASADQGFSDFANIRALRGRIRRAVAVCEKMGEEVKIKDDR